MLSSIKDAIDKENSKEFYNLLLGKNINELNQQMDDGTSILLYCIIKGNYNFAKTLLKIGANPDLARNDGAYPLWITAQQGNNSMIETLLNYGADYECQYQNKTALMIATENCHQGVVEILERSTRFRKRREFKYKISSYIKSIPRKLSSLIITQ